MIADGLLSFFTWLSAHVRGLLPEWGAAPVGFDTDAVIWIGNWGRWLPMEELWVVGQWFMVFGVGLIAYKCGLKIVDWLTAVLP